MTTSNNEPADPLNQIAEAAGLPMPGATSGEDDWEGFLLVALDSLEEECFGMSNSLLAEVEGVVGMQLPFEVGMLLIMGVPDDDRWVRWEDNPQKVWDDWTETVRSGVQFDVEHNAFWLAEWGPKPKALADQRDRVAEHVAVAPPLFPLYGHRAIPLSTPTGYPSSMGNPVLSIVQTDVIRFGNDVGAWMHKDFGVPLPAWSAEGERWRNFGMWTEMMMADESA